MSDNPVITESAIQEIAETANTENSAEYQEHDKSEALEAALDEKAEAETQESSEEPSTEESTEEKPKDDFNAKFAALSRREKSLRERESSIDEKLALLDKKLEALESPKEPEIEKEPELPLEYRLKKNPLETLKELGLPYDQLTQLALNDGKLTPDMQMKLWKEEMQQDSKSEIEALRKEIEDKRREEEENNYNNVVTNFKTELTNYINNDDKFELIRANDAVDVVFDVIDQHYKDTGRILSKEDASNHVETYLEGQLDQLLKLNKLKSKLGTQTSEVKEPSKEPIQTPKAPTLSNAHSTAASKPSSRTLTRDESLAQAASLLKWNE